MNALNTPVTSVMTRDVVSVEPSQFLIEVKHIFEKKNFHHHIPVTENNSLVGMITLTDFLYAIKNASLDDQSPVYHELKVKDIMRPHPVTISASATLKEAAEVLAKGEIHAIVVSDHGALEGIISTADVIRYFLKEDKSSQKKRVLNK
jgi:CBS domain-containing protein